MKKINVFVISTILIVLVFLSSVYFIQQQNKQKINQKNKKTIVTTTNMLYDLTQHILYDKFNDKNIPDKKSPNNQLIDHLLELKKPMMGVGVDPHNYKPLPNHRLIILQSDLIVINGLHLEANMEKAFQLLISEEKPDKLFNVGEKLKENPNNHIIKHDGVDDPHIWFNYKLWMEAGELLKEEIKNLIDKTEKTDGETKTKAKNILNDNFTNYKNTVMKKIDEAIKALKSIPENKRYLVTSHDAFSYFGKVARLKIEAIQGTSTQTEASIGDIRRIAQNIKDKQIKAIFTESSMTNNTLQSLKEMVEKDGYHIKMCEGENGLFSDSLNANLNYLQTFLHNIKIITKELNK
ncbi:metal ABC transporter solute-binding protein, Zn/Mn family [Italian clover phyllody phytoplasma]|uniref:metal ABC transporter solute-binding protein, Zn/Mn family n=1 Tax=Italian clover phyllody phytoplasma TaxID=1196420 RepID=UPI0002FC81AF|nr:zinc ABC transporter substrate-binding protein [Italian clover phyllody phytoplasma]